MRCRARNTQAGYSVMHGWSTVPWFELTSRYRVSAETTERVWWSDICLHCQPFLKISCKSVQKFLRKVANKQTNDDENVSALAEVITSENCNYQRGCSGIRLQRSRAYIYTCVARSCPKCKRHLCNILRCWPRTGPGKLNNTKYGDTMMPHYTRHGYRQNLYHFCTLTLLDPIYSAAARGDENFGENAPPANTYIISKSIKQVRHKLKTQKYRGIIHKLWYFVKIPQRIRLNATRQLYPKFLKIYSFFVLHPSLNLRWSVLPRQISQSVVQRVAPLGS